MNTRQWYTGNYLQSDHWKELRLVKIEEVGRKCEICSKRWNLEVHHRKYRPYKERLSDLKVLCDECHARHHEAEMASRFDKRPVSELKQPPKHWSDNRRPKKEMLDELEKHMESLIEAKKWKQLKTFKKDNRKLLERLRKA